MDDDRVWEVRAFVYRHFAETTYAPGVEEVASQFGLSREQAVAAYAALHDRHALYLQPGTNQILMANPFSGVETPFQVHANDKSYYANCAWDSLGIPAALHTDAEIEAICSQSRELVRLRVTDGNVQDTNVLVHFLVPFREWYNDLVAT